ncbi:MAG: HDOD domain-containing protein [Gammaproteobacteria bacterium]|nr:HDOD domain-containing protein [Gammaproteobacteria bacterium]
MSDNNELPPAPHASVQDILMLPPLPSIAYKLLELVEQEDTNIADLAALIEQDPGLAARIIGIANSAYYARPTEICSVTEAIVRVLGLNLVRGIAIGIALSKPFDASACADFQLDRYWYRAMLTANLAMRLAPLSNLEDPARKCLFLCGLLHNLGQLVLVNAFPARMSQVFKQWAQQPDQSLLALESKQLAINEIEAGSIIARRWQLPTSVASVISFRREPQRAYDTAALVELVAYCSDLASNWYSDPTAASGPLSTAGPAVADSDPERFAKLLEQARDKEPEIRSLAQALASA